MAMPDFSLRQLLEAGVHFGHHTRRWNPRMAPYLYGVRNQVHIIDLQQTVPMLDRSLRAVRDVVAGGGRVLFVGTKRAAAEYVAESARRPGPQAWAVNSHAGRLSRPANSLARVPVSQDAAPRRLNRTRGPPNHGDARVHPAPVA